MNKLESVRIRLSTSMRGAVSDRQASRLLGFTLIELLAVMVLTGLLLAALVTVLRAQVRELYADRAFASQGVSQRVLATLRQDLNNSRAHRFTGGALHLLGYCERTINGEQLLTPAVVVYLSKDSSKGRVLSRIQVSPDGARFESNLCLGVAFIDVKSPRLDSATPALPAELVALTRLVAVTSNQGGAASSLAPTSWEPIPPAFVTQLKSIDNHVLASIAIYSEGSD